MADTIDTPPRSRKPRGQGASRRGEILKAATRLFLDEGVAQVTMRRIAAAVGVSPTALYVYFPDKDAILQAIAEAWCAELLSALEASQRDHDSVAGRFRAGLRAYVDFGLARPDGYRLTFLNKATTRVGCDDIPAADHSFAILQRSVEDMVAAGVFRPTASECAAEAIWACLHGLTALLMDQAPHVETPPAVLVDHVIDMIVAGHR